MWIIYISDSSMNVDYLYQGVSNLCGLSISVSQQFMWIISAIKGCRLSKDVSRSSINMDYHYP